MKKKHYVSLALALYRVLSACRLDAWTRTRIISAVADWASLQASPRVPGEQFRGDLFVRTAETGEVTGTGTEGHIT